MNIGPTQQSIEANFVYQREAITRANQGSSFSDDSLLLGIIDLFIFFGALMTVGMPLKECVDFDVQWQVWGFWIVELVTLGATFYLINLLRKIAFLGIAGTAIYAAFTHLF